MRKIMKKIMKKKCTWLVMSLMMMCSVILWKPVTASAVEVGISEVLLYPSGCLKQFTLNSRNRDGLAPAYCRYAVHTQNDRYDWDNRYTGDGQTNWSLAETEQFKEATHLVAWGAGDEIEYTRTDIDFAIPICFADGVIRPDDNVSYHVIMWVRSELYGLYCHPDSLAVLTLGDGQLSNNGVELHTCVPGEVESIDGSGHHYPLCDDDDCTYGNNTNWSAPEAHTYPTSGDNIYTCSVCGYTDTARQAADRYRSDWEELLSKDSADRGDLAQIEAALDAYDDLPQAAKDLLAEEKAKLDELLAQAEADQAAYEAAEAFRREYSEVLSKTSGTREDLPIIEQALADYADQPEAVKAYLTAEKAKLDALKAQAAADQAAFEAAEAFRREYSEVLSKTRGTWEDLPVIEQALADYADQPEAVKAYLTAEKVKLDNLKAQAEADKVAADAADAFRQAQEEVLSLRKGTELDLEDIQEVLRKYDELPAAVKEHLADEKAKLDELLKQAEADEAAKDFREKYEKLLSKKKATAGDLKKIEKVLKEFDQLPENVRLLLTAEKAKLLALQKQAQAETDKIKDSGKNDPVTGDTLHVLQWLSLMLLSGAVLAVFLEKGRKKNHR